MDRVYDKEKSSRKTRNERERDKESTKDHHDRHREHKHRSSRYGRSRDSVERHHSNNYREVKHRVSDRYRSKDHSYDHEESKRERSHERDSSRDEREKSVQRRTLSSSHKRKERGDSEERFDKSEKRVRAFKEEKRERWKFEVDDAGEDSRDLNGTSKEEKRERRKFEDGNKEEAMRDGKVEKRERRRFEDKAKEEDVTVVDEERDNKQAYANNVQSHVPSNGSGAKKKKEQSRSMDALPSDITLEIFSRLPCESVLQCKQVCKFWRALLLHKFDIKMSFVFAIGLDGEQLDNVQLCYGELRRTDDEININDDKSSCRKLTWVDHPSIVKKGKIDTIVGSCNGLVCFSIPRGFIGDSVYVCNPTTKEYAYLPELNRRPNCMVNGFGYHLSTNEYKVVRIYYGTIKQFSLVIIRKLQH